MEEPYESLTTTSSGNITTKTEVTTFKIRVKEKGKGTILGFQSQKYRTKILNRVGLIW